MLCKKMGLAPGGPGDVDGVEAFLSKALSPPHFKAVTNAVEVLVELGAMEAATNELTSLGHRLALLSLEPRVGRMVIWSYFLGCARIVAAMATSMSYKSPFVIPPPSRRKASEEAKVRLSQNSESDQLTTVNVLRQRDKLGKGGQRLAQFFQQNFLNPSTVTMISDLRRSLARELEAIGFPPPASMGQFYNRQGEERALWEAAIAAGLYPNIASRRAGETNFSTSGDHKAKIHMSSVNAVNGQRLSRKSTIGDNELELVCFGELVKGKSSFTISSTTRLTSPLPLFLLCGNKVSIRPNPNKCDSSILILDDRIAASCETRTAKLLFVLRKRLHKAFCSALNRPKQNWHKMEKKDRDAIELVDRILCSAYDVYSKG